MSKEQQVEQLINTLQDTLTKEGQLKEDLKEQVRGYSNGKLIKEASLNLVPQTVKSAVISTSTTVATVGTAIVVGASLPVTITVGVATFGVSNVVQNSVGEERETISRGWGRMKSSFSALKRKVKRAKNGTIVGSIKSA